MLLVTAARRLDLISAYVDQSIRSPIVIGLNDDSDRQVQARNGFNAQHRART